MNLVLYIFGLCCGLPGAYVLKGWRAASAWIRGVFGYSVHGIGEMLIQVCIFIVVVIICAVLLLAATMWREL